MDALEVIAAEPLDTGSTTPLYQQLKQRMLLLIASGTLDDEMPLPGELAIAERFGLSRATVRRCFKDLVDEGHVVRRRGAGSFVARPVGSGGIDSLYASASFSNAIRHSGRNPGSRLLRLRRVKAGESVAKRLGLNEGDLVWEISRVRLVDDEPAAIDISYVPCALASEFSEEDLNRSIYKHIAAESGVLPTRMEMRYEVTSLRPSEAKLLGQRAGTPALREVATAYDMQGSPIDTSALVIAQGRMRLGVVLTAAGVTFDRLF